MIRIITMTNDQYESEYKLIPIDINPDENIRFIKHPECVSI